MTMIRESEEEFPMNDQIVERCSEYYFREMHAYKKNSEWVSRWHAAYVLCIVLPYTTIWATRMNVSLTMAMIRASTHVYIFLSRLGVKFAHLCMWMHSVFLFSQSILTRRRKKDSRQ